MKTRRRRRNVAATAAVLGAALAVLAALTTGLGQASAKTGAASAQSPLRKACGSKIVIQSDWFPEPEHGAVYQLAGTRGSFDKEKGRYTGSAKGVQIEIRAGGPFTGFQQPISQLYQDSSITLGFATSDEQIQLGKKLPLVSIVSPFEYSPQILMWNPQELSIKTFADIKRTGAKVLVFAGGAWVDYLQGKGWVSAGQVDTSYDGSPTRFVAANGKIVQQGFATSEPWQYRHDIPQYGKNVKFLLIKDSGYTPYPQTLAAKPSVVSAKAACFKLLVPMVQRAQIAYVQHPQATNRLLERLVTELNTFWKLTPAGDAYNTATQKKLGLVQNGPDCTLGNFNMKRLQGVINRVLPIFKAKGLDTINPNLRAGNIATNRFIDRKVGMPKKGCAKRK
jgi:ABC-type nitrate/sulfonate/bicarbonate transport system substrate-binding protein